MAKQNGIAEDGQSIRKVFVNGRIVVDDGQILTLNEADILAEFRERLPTYRQLRKSFHQQGRNCDQPWSEFIAEPWPIPCPLTT